MWKRFARASALGVAALALALGGGLLSGCATYLQPYQVERATPTPRTPVSQELRQLPAAQEPVVVAVYRFRDQTGQYRALENASTFSTAVTQGATSILIRALEESGWFVPIEREGLSNLLNERQIIQSIRAQNAGPDGQPLGPLPPLLYAGVLLEGGIIGYDSNVHTSGAGLRYFGTGGSGTVRQDQVTIYLRAVSTQSGRVLKTVYTTKTILSQRVDGGVFRYVDLRRLLEVEAGYSFNEPPVLAVTEAIEEAVKALVIEGVRDGLWALRNGGDTAHPAFAAYDADVARADRTDTFGNALRATSRGTGVGALAGGALYSGDYRNAVVRPMGELVLRQPLSRRFSLALTGSGAELAADSAFTVRHVGADVQALYTLMPDQKASPYLGLGAGALFQFEPRPAPAQGGGLFPYLTAEAGLQLEVLPRLDLLAGVSFDYPLREGLDGIQLGRVNDSFTTFRTGLIYYTR